jgi:DNA-binding response OmpR family regulator
MKKKVLIVDDEPDVVDSLKVILKKNRYKVETASNGDECIKKLEEGFKGVVLLDLLMPEKDGWETLKEIVDKGYIKNVAIEVISALGQRENKRMTSLEPYIYDYLTKPLDISEFVSSVKRCNEFLFARGPD